MPKNLSEKWNQDVLQSAEKNHIWLNAFSCIRPTDEFKIKLADQILSMLNNKENLIYEHQDHEDQTWRELGRLTPQLVLRINKS